MNKDTHKLDKARKLDHQMKVLLKEERRTIEFQARRLMRWYGFTREQARGLVISALGHPRDIERLWNSKFRSIVIRDLVIDLLRRERYLPRKKPASDKQLEPEPACYYQPDLDLYRSSTTFPSCYELLSFHELLSLLASFLESSGNSARGHRA